MRYGAGDWLEPTAGAWAVRHPGHGHTVHVNLTRQGSGLMINHAVHHPSISVSLEVIKRDRNVIVILTKYVGTVLFVSTNLRAHTGIVAQLQLLHHHLS